MGYRPGAKSLRAVWADIEMNVLQGMLSLGASGKEAGRKEQAGKRYSGILEDLQAKQKKTFNFGILRVIACKMDPVLSSHFIDSAIFPGS